MAAAVEKQKVTDRYMNFPYPSPYSSLMLVLRIWSHTTGWRIPLFPSPVFLTKYWNYEEKLDIDNFFFVPQAEAARQVAASQNVPSNFKDLIQNLVSLWVQFTKYNYLI